MPQLPRLPEVKIKPYFLDIRDYSKGTLTNINETRADTKYAIESSNMEQYADGIWRTRPGLRYYGTEIAGVDTIDGAIEFEKSDGTRLTIAIAGGYAWSSQDGGAWTQLSGATFTAGYRPYFLQSRNSLYVSNRHDAFTLFNGTSFTSYSAITDPSAPTLNARNTLTSGSFNNYYRVVITNEVGFTNPSSSLNVTTNKHRDNWGSGESVVINLPTIGTGTGYQIFWGDYDGEELLVAELTETATTFTDTGAADFPVNEYIETPDDNTTAAPKFGPMEISGNRMWGTYDPDNPWRVYFSGTGIDFARFSSFYSGGYIDLEKGGRFKPISVVHYRTGKGDPIVTVLCQSADGIGTTFQVEITSATVGDVTFAVPVAYKITGSIGADAPMGVVKAGNILMFPNKKGAYILQNQAQLFQILSTDDDTASIRNRWESLNQKKISDIAGYYKAPRVYFSVAQGSENDTTVIRDLERKNWTWAWSRGFKQFFEYTENSTGDSSTHFLAIPTSGNQLIEISENYVGDFGSAFYQSYISPLIPVDNDKTTKAKVKYGIAEIGNLQGSVAFQVLGLTDDGQVTALATGQASSTTGTSGWGDDSFSSMFFSDTDDTPTTFTQRSQEITVRVEKKLKAIQFKVYSNDLSRYEILRIQAKGTLIPGRPQYN